MLLASICTASSCPTLWVPMTSSSASSRTSSRDATPSRATGQAIPTRRASSASIPSGSNLPSFAGGSDTGEAADNQTEGRNEYIASLESFIVSFEDRLRLLNIQPPLMNRVTTRNADAPHGRVAGVWISSLEDQIETLLVEIEELELSNIILNQEVYTGLSDRQSTQRRQDQTPSTSAGQ